MHRTAVVALSSLVVCLVSTLPAASADDALKAASEKVFPALVKVKVVVNKPVWGRTVKGYGSGSGFIISEDGYVVTNHHVAGNAERITCWLPDKQDVPATLIGTDPALDVAVLRLDLTKRKGKKPLVPCNWGDSAKLKIGEKVYAMGSPAGVSQSVTTGTVSNTSMIIPRDRLRGDQAKLGRLDGEDMGGIVRWIGHDAVIFGGNSGGPLVNTSGEVVGINQVGIGSLGGAIPSNDARKVVDQIIEFGEVRRSWTGLVVQKRLGGDGKKGVLVGGVLDDSPASKAGIKPGDLITSWDEVDVDASSDEDLVPVKIRMLETEIAKEVAVGVSRDGKPLALKLMTVLRDRRLGRSAELNAWGITGRNISDMMARERHLKDRSGVMVDTIRPGGPAKSGQPPLKHGDMIVEVNGRTIVDLADLRRLTRNITEENEGQTPITVKVRRGKEEVLTVVKIGREKDEVIPELTRYATLGIATQVFNRDLAKALGQPGVAGVRVTRVKKNSAGAKAGLEVGDVITAIDGRPVAASRIKDNELFEQMIRESEVGATVKLKVVRDKKPIELAASLAEEPLSADRVAHHFDKTFEYSVRNLTVDDRDRLHLPSSVKGVFVRDVESAGWANLANLSVGDILISVNDMPTPDIVSLRTAMEAIGNAEPERVTFYVRRGIRTYFRTIQPNWKPEGEDEDE